MAHPLTRIENFNYDALNKELQLTKAEKESLDVLLKAYLDDFWQGGKGSLLPPASGRRADQVNALFEKRFVFRNVIRECVSRVAGAFFGKAPNWKFQINGADVERPRPEDIANSNDPLALIDKALNDLWTRQGVAEALVKAFESRLAFGRGGIRIYIPTKFKRQNLIPQEGQEPNTGGSTGEQDFVAFPDIATAIAAMRVEFVMPTQARLLDDGAELFSIVRYEVRKDWQTQDHVNVIEFSFVDNAELTFLGTIEEKSSGSSLAEANLSSPFNLAGATTYNEFKGIPYVTKALYKNNQLVNLALTCAGFSLVDNGFGEMILTNVELETEMVTGSDGEAVEVPKKIARGGGAVQNFVGIQEVVDETTGEVRRATPGVTFRQPTSMDAFEKGRSMGYRSCLEEAGQLYALISGDATASGESRIQALSDFLIKISPLKPEVDEQGSWLMTTVLLWAAALSNTALDGYRVMFDSRMHVANLSPDERRLVMTMREQGVISRETERVLLGIDDPTLEAELVQREQETSFEEAQIDDLNEKLDLGLKMQSLSIDVQTIQKFLGFDDAQIAEMQQRKADEEAALLAQIDAQNGDGAGAVDQGDFAAAQGA